MKKVITTEMRNEVISMTKEGHSINEICSAVGISRPSVTKVRKEAGLKVVYGKGGIVARTIPIEEIRKSSHEEPDEDDVPPVMIADQMITICGTETLTVYKAELRKDTISVDGGLVIGEIKIDQIVNLANELKGVYDLVTRMKGNRFGLM